jgi:hypothetical protein
VAITNAGRADTASADMRLLWFSLGGVGMVALISFGPRLWIALK